MSRITKETFARYDQNLKWWHQNRLASKNALKNFHQTEEAGAVAFWPVGGTPLEGKVKFSFKETPPASGDKSPTNPSTITGMSSINIKRYGKNCGVLQLARAAGYVNYTVNQDGSFRVYGTIPSSTIGDCINIFSSNTLLANDYLKKGMQYTVSFDSTDSNMLFAVYSHTAENGYSLVRAISPGTSGSFVIPQDSDTYTWLRVWCGRKNNADTEYDGVCRVQIELGSQATEKELPAVVDSYDIPLGSTYYGGEIDLATGLMTVTHNAVSLAGNTNFSSSLYGAFETCCRVGFYPGRKSKSSAYASDVSVDTLQTYVANIYNNSPIGVYITSNSTSISVCLPNSITALSSSSTNAEISTAFNAWFAQNPTIVVYELTTPQTVQLDPVSLAALAQTSRHEPRLNTVYTDADSIQITYQKSPIRAATEAEQAILSLGGNI